MEFPDFSPRRELQGPRPTPLRISKDSHKIKKPPIAPPQQQQQQQPIQQQPPQRRGPIIIYTTSPKVIHTNPNEFMTLVQSLTGSSSSTSTSTSWSTSMTSSSLFSNTENANKSYEINGVDTMELVGSFPGILSPGPSSLIPISPNFFSVSPDPNLLSFLHDLSPIFHGNKNYIEGSFMPSPVSFFTSTPKASPTQSFDLFNLFQNY